MKATLPTRYFDALYADSADPWDFETSAYEREKYAATLAAMPRPRYRRALEVGCSIGVFTPQLAPRCERLVALEPAHAALASAQRRCAGLDIDFRPLAVPTEWPDGTFDLVLLSEVVYYLDRSAIDQLARRLDEAVASGGDVVLVHYTGETDYPLGGDEAVEALIAAVNGFCTPITSDRQPRYRLDVLRRH